MILAGVRGDFPRRILIEEVQREALDVQRVVLGEFERLAGYFLGQIGRWTCCRGLFRRSPPYRRGKQALRDRIGGQRRVGFDRC
jgi:hypothetical protein